MSDSSPQPAVIESRSFNLPVDNIDTDQIIPAQFLTTTERAGMGQYCFHGWRFEADGTPRVSSPFRRHDRSTQQVLVAGSNFGCGSSREHAPWALLDYGFRAVVSSRFADIFRSNALQNGLLPVTVDDSVIQYLFDHPDHAVRIDIGARLIQIEGYGDFEFPIDPFSAFCLTRGIDPLEFILRHEEMIRDFEDGRAP